MILRERGVDRTNGLISPNRREAPPPGSPREGELHPGEGAESGLP